MANSRVDYLEAWELQRRLHAQRVDDEIDDTVLFLEHPFVYTAGRRTEPQDRPMDGTPVVEVDRGGKITWHGPGQLVAYPITKLPSHVYVVDFVRRLEEALIRVCSDLGLETGRVTGRSGVWLAASGTQPERKVAALGIRVSRGVTMHGVELELQQHDGGLRRHHPVRHRRCRRDDPQPRARPRHDGRGGRPAVGTPPS